MWSRFSWSAKRSSGPRRVTRRKFRNPMRRATKCCLPLAASITERIEQRRTFFLLSPARLRPSLLLQLSLDRLHDLRALRLHAAAITSHHFAVLADEEFLEVPLHVARIGRRRVAPTSATCKSASGASPSRRSSRTDRTSRCTCPCRIRESAAACPAPGAGTGCTESPGPRAPPCRYFSCSCSRPLYCGV